MKTPIYKSAKEINFKERFIAAFLATWCANNYTDYCMRGMQKELENPPVADAEHLAETAWAKYVEVCH